MRKGRRLLSGIAIAATLSLGCGDILKEIDNANDLAGKPTGMRPGAAPPKPGAGPPKTGASGATAPGAKPGAASEEPDTITRLVSQVKQLLGLEPEDGRRRSRPDPNDPMVLCRLPGSTGYMLKSGCINRQGRVIASKGPQR